MQSVFFDVMAVRTTTNAVEGVRRAVKKYRGHLVELPDIGSPMIMIRPGRRQLITSSVVRVLRSCDGRMLFVQTQNSVYRLCIGESRDAPGNQRRAGDRPHFAEHSDE